MLLNDSKMVQAYSASVEAWLRANASLDGIGLPPNKLIESGFSNPLIRFSTNDLLSNKSGWYALSINSDYSVHARVADNRKKMISKPYFFKDVRDLDSFLHASQMQCIMDSSPTTD